MQMKKEECIFCKMIKNKKDIYTVMEGKNYISFLDAYPASLGHALVVPKKHYKNIYEIPKKILADLIVVCKKIAVNYRDKKRVSSINIINSNGKYAQQDVEHFHFHIVPRYESDNIKLYWKNKRDELKNKFKVFLEDLK